MPKIPVKVVEWKDVVDWSRELARRIVATGFQPDVIVAIARGGVAPARLLCDYLGVLDLLALKVEHWVETAGRIHEDAVVKYPLSVDFSGKSVLLVDDICDTGRSIVVSRSYLIQSCRPKELKVATMQYIKPVAQIEPDFYVDLVEEWVWYMYPWNYMEDSINLIKKILQENPMRALTLEELSRRFEEDYGIAPPLGIEEPVREGARRNVFKIEGDRVRLREQYFMV